MSGADPAARLGQDPSLRLLAVDARHFVRTTPRRYDLVVGDLFVPWRAGEGAMFTREHFAAVRRTLAPGGAFCQRLRLYQLAPRELATIAATLCDVFPRVDAFWLDFNVDQPALGLVASDAPLELDPIAMHELGRSSSARRHLLEEAGLADPVFTIASFVAGERTLRRLAPVATVESSAHPRIEFDAPRSRFAAVSPLAEQCLRLLLDRQEDLAEASVAAALDDATRQRCAAAQRAVASWFRGACRARYSGDTAGALREYVQALALVPGWSWILFNVAERCDQLLRSGTEEELRAAIEILREPPPGTSWPRDFARELQAALAGRAAARH